MLGVTVRAMSLRRFVASPFNLIAGIIDPPPPKTFFDRFTENFARELPDIANHLLHIAHTGFVHKQQVAADACAHNQIDALRQYVEKLHARYLIDKGFKDPLPKPGEVLGDYVNRLQGARVGGLIWVWDEPNRTWKALDHHISTDQWTPAPGCGEVPPYAPPPPPAPGSVPAAAPVG